MTENKTINASSTKAEAYADVEEARSTGDSLLLLQAGVFWAGVSAQRRSARYLCEGDIEYSAKLIGEVFEDYNPPKYLLNASKLGKYLDFMEGFLHEKGYELRY